MGFNGLLMGLSIDICISLGVLWTVCGKVSTPSWVGWVNRLCSPLWVNMFCPAKWWVDQSWLLQNGSAKTASAETRSVCSTCHVKDKELNDFGNTWAIPHCFLIMSHWKNCDVQGVSTSWRVRLCYLAENLQSVSWCSHHHVGIAPISMGIYKWLILTISSSWNRWLFQIYWLPKHGWPILWLRCANFGVDLISHSNWSFRRSFRWAWDIKESENLMKNIS